MKILYVDIETRAAQVQTWGLFKQNIGINQVDIPTSMICFAAKWQGKNEVFFHSDIHDGHDLMVEAAWKLLNEADVVVGWNSNGFDLPHMNREFIEAGLLPPEPYIGLDLMHKVKAKFRFLSNKLDWISERLVGDNKVSHEGFGLWRKCLNGDVEAWDKMKEYNERDVTLLEELHEILLPWIGGIPNAALDHDDDKRRCVYCASCNLNKKGVRRTSIGKYQRYRCNDCGGWSQDRKNIGTSVLKEAR